MSDVEVYIEPVAPWSRQAASEINRRRNRMTMPGSRDVDTGVPTIPIDPTKPCGPVYQPDLHLPGIIGTIAPVRWLPAIAAIALVTLAAAIAGTVG